MNSKYTKVRKMSNQTAREWLNEMAKEHENGLHVTFFDISLGYGERCRDEGVGTCKFNPWKVDQKTGFYDCLECSCCGHVSDVSYHKNYCPNCGRKVVNNG